MTYIMDHLGKNDEGIYGAIEDNLYEQEETIIKVYKPVPGGFNKFDTTRMTLEIDDGRTVYNIVANTSTLRQVASLINMAAQEHGLPGDFENESH